MKPFLLPTLLLLPLAWLAGCNSMPDPLPERAAPAVAAPAPPPPPPAPPCNAAGAQFAVGQSTTPQLEVAAAHRANAASARTLKPGQVMTMEFDASRLNLVVDAKGRVTAVRCG